MALYTGEENENYWQSMMDKNSSWEIVPVHLKRLCMEWKFFFTILHTILLHFANSYIKVYWKCIYSLRFPQLPILIIFDWGCIKRSAKYVGNCIVTPPVTCPGFILMSYLKSIFQQRHFTNSPHNTLKSHRKVKPEFLSWKNKTKRLHFICFWWLCMNLI